MKILLNDLDNINECLVGFVEDKNNLFFNSTGRIENSFIFKVKNNSEFALNNIFDLKDKIYKSFSEIEFQDLSRNESHGFFITNKNRFLYSDGLKHIDYIIKYPEKFNLAFEYIKNIHQKYNEPLGIEGKARKELLKDLILNDFVHIRFLPREALWRFNCKLTKSNLENINLFMKCMVNNGLLKRNDKLLIKNPFYREN